VEVIQEGMSYPQPSEEETKEAVKELVNELSVMDQATQTPPQPTLEEIFNSKVKLAELFDSPEAFAKAMNGERKVNTPKYQTPPPEGDTEPFTRMVNLANMLRTPAERLHGLPPSSGSFGRACVQKWMGVCQMSRVSLFAVLC